MFEVLAMASSMHSPSDKDYKKLVTLEPLSAGCLFSSCISMRVGVNICLARRQRVHVQFSKSS